MAQKENKKVVVSSQFNADIISVFEYGEEIFGTSAAKSFVGEIYSKIWNLDEAWTHYPECRHLHTNDQRYRNIILGNYLIIYRVFRNKIKVLRILHAHSSITKIRSSRDV